MTNKKPFIKLEDVNPLFKSYLKNGALTCEHVTFFILFACKLISNLNEQNKFKRVNGNALQVSNKHIQEELDVSYRKRKKLIEELVSHGFLAVTEINGGENIYTFTKGVSFGSAKPIKEVDVTPPPTPFPSENTYIPPNKELCFHGQKLSHFSSSTPKQPLPQHVSRDDTQSSRLPYQVNSPYNNVMKEKTTTIDEVVVIPFTFSERSPFKRLSTAQWKSFQSKFDNKRIQKYISDLEKRYAFENNQIDSGKKNIDENPGGLLYRALQQGWEFNDNQAEKEQNFQNEIEDLKAGYAQFDECYQ